VRRSSDERDREEPRDIDRRLTARAIEWIATLPPRVRPDALATEFPRLTNRLALCWSDPELRFQVLDSLLVDRRGGRGGFPPDVLRDLLKLHEWHDDERRSASAAAAPGSNVRLFDHESLRQCAWAESLTRTTRPAPLQATSTID